MTAITDQHRVPGALTLHGKAWLFGVNRRNREIMTFKTRPVTSTTDGAPTKSDSCASNF